MKGTDELEPQQYERLYWEEDTPVKDVRKTVLRKSVYIGGFLCLGLILAGMLLKFPDQLELPFVLKNDKSEEIYRFPYPVYVTEKYVSPGIVVETGQPLVKITSPEIVTLINNYREAEDNLSNFKMQKEFSAQKQRKMIEVRVEQTRNKITELVSENTAQAAAWKSNLERLEYENSEAVKKYEANKKLYEAGFISLFDFKEFEASKIRAADSLYTARLNYEMTQNRQASLHNQYLLDKSSMEEELSKLTIDTRHDSVSLINQFELVKNKIRNTYGQFEIHGGELILNAGQNGIVSYIFDGEKEVAHGAILLKIINNNSAIYAWIKSPPSLIGKIAKKEKTILKVASFPFFEWGTLKGEVDNISLTPDESGNFSVKIRIGDYGKLYGMLQSGMDGNAVIILEEKTFFAYFFRKTKKTYYQLSLEE